MSNKFFGPLGVRDRERESIVILFIKSWSLFAVLAFLFNSSTLINLYFYQYWFLYVFCILRVQTDPGKPGKHSISKKNWKIQGSSGKYFFSLKTTQSNRKNFFLQVCLLNYIKLCFWKWVSNTWFSFTVGLVDHEFEQGKSC